MGSTPTVILRGPHSVDPSTGVGVTVASIFGSWLGRFTINHFLIPRWWNVGQRSPEVFRRTNHAGSTPPPWWTLWTLRWRSVQSGHNSVPKAVLSRSKGRRGPPRSRRREGGRRVVTGLRATNKKKKKLKARHSTTSEVRGPRSEVQPSVFQSNTL